MVRAYAYLPAVKDVGTYLYELAGAARDGVTSTFVDTLLHSTLQNTSSSPELRFSLSLLSDIITAGGTLSVRDSQLFVAWPDWDGASGRIATKAAMATAKDMRPLRPKELAKVAPCFAPEMTGDALARVMAEGTFTLRSSDDRHPTGVSYADVFAAGLRYWSMPYRGRTGRLKRFVVTVEHPETGPHPVLVGLLELGDEAPFCLWRDKMLGFSPEEFMSWAQQGGPSRWLAIGDRMKRIRSMLNPNDDTRHFGQLDTDYIFAHRTRLEQEAHGRSLADRKSTVSLKDTKRITYAVRLARGEYAMRSAVLSGFLDFSSDVRAGVRAIHDIVVPRVHLEVGICGAVPPFAQALGGKLMIEFFAHPDILRASTQSESSLLSWSFAMKDLEAELPRTGLLCISTKGLYANHAPLYERSEMPGMSRPVKLRHIANTGGQTTSLVSERTARLAGSVIEGRDGSNTVSKVYGTGGAKRHRLIEAAVSRAGLPAMIAHAGIHRPVYGASFVANAPDVAWFNETPDWLVDPKVTPVEYEARAAALWRKRWLARAQCRAHDYALTPSFSYILSHDNHRNNSDSESD
jgi:hypothetical protein